MGVATGFPSGQFPLSTRLEEIRLAVSAGAAEIDIVINRQLALENKWQELYNEVVAMKEACGSAHMKSILAIGELELVMCRAIREYQDRTGFRVGFKPAGGIRTAKDATTWLIMIKEELGDGWLNNKMFRIGASGLLLDIERQLFHWVTGRYAAAHELAMS